MTDSALYYVARRGNTLYAMRLCAAACPGQRGRCIRHWGHPDEHENQYGILWEPETPETTDNRRDNV